VSPLIRFTKTCINVGTYWGQGVNINSKIIQGVEYFPPVRVSDERGDFIKLFSAPWTTIKPWNLEETFYSYSKQGVIRGLHLQTGESENWRLISVIEGDIFDVLHDLRDESPTNGETITSYMSKAETSSVLIPPGVAHGFQAITNCIILYQSSKHYVRERDLGINIEAIQIDWPIEPKIMSARDRNLPMVKNW
jgi:dTDP-4-dehydrorhamnose 3,5-epimerase